MPPSKFARLVGFSLLRFNADKATGGGGGDKTKTDLEKLQDAEAEVKQLKATLATEKKRADEAEAAKKTAEDSVTTLTTEKGELQGKLDQANGTIQRLEGEKKTVDQKAQEIAAAHGSNAAAGAKEKDAAAQAGGQPDGKAHYDAYQTAMAAGDNLKASQIWNQHLKAIEAYVATLK